MPRLLKTFHSFPKLSVEVREMIWELALPAGRRHRIEYAQANTYVTDPQPKVKDKKVCVPQFHVGSPTSGLPTL
jgi:hypothetical protein